MRGLHAHNCDPLPDQMLVKRSGCDFAGFSNLRAWASELCSFLAPVRCCVQGRERTLTCKFKKVCIHVSELKEKSDSGCQQRNMLRGTTVSLECRSEGTAKMKLLQAHTLTLGIMVS